MSSGGRECWENCFCDDELSVAALAHFIIKTGDNVMF